MGGLLPDRVAWYVAGPLLGLCIVALYALANERLGAIGTYSDVASFLVRPRARAGWRVWFFGGIAAGALVVALLRGDPTLTGGYGTLGGLLPVGVLILVLFAGGAVMGYGARWAGGCTSGHGMSGVASRSIASLAACMTFFGTAVAVTFALHALTGGAL